VQINNRKWINLHEKQTQSEIVAVVPVFGGSATFFPSGEIDRHMIIDPEAYAWQTRTRLRSHPAMRGFLSELDF